VWFHNAIARLFEKIDRCATIFDDACLGEETFGAFEALLIQFLDTCIAANVKLKAKKAVIGVPSVRFVGRILSGDKIEVDKGRLQGLLDATPPQDKNTLRSYLSTVNWINNFVPHLAAIAAPLWNLLRKDAEYKWTDDHNRSFEGVKKAIENTWWLEHPDGNALLLLRTDACKRGIAAVLPQRHEDGSIGAIAFYSRKLTSAERGYPAIEQEALAIV